MKIGILTYLLLRRRIFGDVYDRRSEKVLCCHEENGKEKAS